MTAKNRFDFLLSPTSSLFWLFRKICGYPEGTVNLSGIRPVFCLEEFFQRPTNKALWCEKSVKICTVRLKFTVPSGGAITQGSMVDIEIRDARPHEVPVAAAVLSRGMRDNPLHLSVFGPEPEERQRKLEQFFRILLGWMPHAPWVSIQHGTIVAVCGMGEPGRCQPTFSQNLNIVTRLAHHFGVASTSRALRWFGAWSLRDPKEAHWHLGPVGVDAHLQGRGIGGQLIGEWCKLLDAHRAAGYLETDKAVNVGFYNKFGFETISEAKVLGTPNWFMLRAAR